MFRTELIVDPAPFKIGLPTPVFTAGSCFAEVIGHKLAENKVPVAVNPFGTVYNPLSLFSLVSQAIEDRPAGPHFAERSGQWFHHGFHSSFTAPAKEALEQQLAQQLQSAGHYLRMAGVLVLTFGTAFAYRLKQDGSLVANCHKMPAALFTRELLTVPAMLEGFAQVFERLRSENPGLRILLTVSPVRHTKDTLPLNAVSKSLLRVLCHEITARWPEVYYFPAYEIMLDDLRDYRFYKDDLIHPTGFAENYIWEKFRAACLDAGANSFIDQWARLLPALSHRPFQPNSEAHRKFLQQTLAALEKLSLQANLAAEMDALRQQLKGF